MPRNQRAAAPATPVTPASLISCLTLVNQTLVFHEIYRNLVPRLFIRRTLGECRVKSLGTRLVFMSEDGTMEQSGSGYDVVSGKAKVI